MATLVATFSTAGTQTLTATYVGLTATPQAPPPQSAWAYGKHRGLRRLEGEEGPISSTTAPPAISANILSNLDGTQTRTGVPLALTVYVFDSKNSRALMQGVQVDIWSCNASGIYSAESVEGTVSQSWLRGYQITDTIGKVQCNTILPAGSRAAPPTSIYASAPSTTRTAVPTPRRSFSARP